MRIVGGWQTRLLRLSLIAVITVTISACGTAGSGFNLISIEEEWALGQRLAADIERQMPIVRDSAINAYVNRVGQQLVAQTEMANLPWNFHVVANPEVNAFNIPGGHVYVTTGLIEAADNVSEFTGVMAHEIAHGVERHATEQMSRQYGLGILAGLALGQNPQVYQQILAQVLGAGTLARFGREAERESDMLGTQYMYRAGYDPRGMVTMFEELLRRRERAPGAVDRFFASHPLTEERIENVEREIARLPRTGALVATDADYQRIRQRASAIG